MEGIGANLDPQAVAVSVGLPAAIYALARLMEAVTPLVQVILDYRLRRSAARTSRPTGQILTDAVRTADAVGELSLPSFAEVTGAGDAGTAAAAGAGKVMSRGRRSRRAEALASRPADRRGCDYLG